jgi:hypothetical protein
MFEMLLKKRQDGGVWVQALTQRATNGGFGAWKRFEGHVLDSHFDCTFTTDYTLHSH